MLGAFPTNGSGGIAALAAAAFPMEPIESVRHFYLPSEVKRAVWSEVQPWCTTFFAPGFSSRPMSPRERVASRNRPLPVFASLTRALWLQIEASLLRRCL